MMRSQGGMPRLNHSMRNSGRWLYIQIRMVTAGNIIALSLIIFIASIVRGFTGFGLALVAVPMIVFIMPVTDTAVFISIINVIFSLLYYRKSKEIVKGQPLGAMLYTSPSPRDGLLSRM